MVIIQTYHHFGNFFLLKSQGNTNKFFTLSHKSTYRRAMHKFEETQYKYLVDTT